LVGTQTLARGLDILNAVAEGFTGIAEIAEALQLSRSTVHRLAATLVEHRYLNFAPRMGYSLGPRASGLVVESIVMRFGIPVGAGV